MNKNYIFFLSPAHQSIHVANWPVTICKVYKCPVGQLGQKPTAAPVNIHQMFTDRHSSLHSQAATLTQ